MNIFNFLQQEKYDTIIQLKMLQASLYSLENGISYLDYSFTKEYLNDEIYKLKILNEDALDELKKLIIKSNKFI